MKDLIQRSYEAIQARGLITDETTRYDFLEKIREELSEAEIECEHITHDLYRNIPKHKKRYIEEITDTMTVCLMQLKHLGCDPIEEFEKVVIKNEQRALQRQK